MALEIFESLSDVEQAKVKGIVSSIREHLSVENEVNLDLLMATLEQLNEVKREARETLKVKEKENAEKEKQRRAALAKEYVSTLSVGGPASFQKQATLPIDKVGLATVQVSYTPDMIVGKSITNKRNIHYDKIIVPEEFVSGKTV